MKLKNLASIATLLLATLTAAQAQTNIIAGWTFDNLTLGVNNSPNASTNTGTASLVGLTTGTVVGNPGSSSGSLVGTNAWDVTGGWSTNNLIASQGAEFAVNTYGDYQVQFSFDVYAATNAEAYLLVQYSPDGLTWFNANITSPGSLGILATNANPTNGIVVGTYLVLTNSGGSWNNGVKVDLSGVSWADNNPNFAIRFVNAATGSNVVSTAGATYTNNASIGDWTFDNVVIQGVPFDTAVDWTFDNLAVAKHINNPAPALSNTVAKASCIGFGTPANHLVSSTFTGGYSTNDADITQNGLPYSSTGSAGQNVWRLRGQPGNGWLTTQPIGSQGAEFDVSTVNYTNIILTFDMYFTSAGEAKMCVEYTTNNVGGVWGSTNVANLAYALAPIYISVNTTNYTSVLYAGTVINTNYSANTVPGEFFFNSYGSIFFNNLVVDLTGIPGVANNPNFAFRIVNAATGLDCVNAGNTAYNNNSGNTRLDNVAVNGKYLGSYAPTVSPAPSATVDHPFTNTFAYNPGWSTNIYAIYINGIQLTNSYTITPSNIVFTPTAGPGQATNPAPLTVAGQDNFVVFATNFTTAKFTQVVGPGAFVALSFIQPAGPSASGGTLTANPSFTCVDQYSNTTSLTYPSMQVIATVSNSPATWTLGGSVTQAIYNGSCTFTDLNATLIGTTAISNAAITFTVANGPITVTNSTSFVIGKPPVPFTPGNLAVFQTDVQSANTTYSIIEIKPSAAGQTNPVNIVPISATGTNALRTANSGSGEHLTLSDNGTFLIIPGYLDNSSATVSEEFNLNRAVGTLDYTNKFGLHAKYVSNSYGGSQIRSACSPDNNNFVVDDKGGLFIPSAANGTTLSPFAFNTISTRSFGGICWVLTAKSVAAAQDPFIFSDGNSASTLDYSSAIGTGENTDYSYDVGNGNRPLDTFEQDFYMVSTNGNDYSILYVVDQSINTNGTASSYGSISKWVDVDGSFDYQPLGAWTNTDNCDMVFATTNGSGGVYVYYSNGSGGKAGNSIIRLTDQSAAGPLNFTSTNTIYTAPSGTSVMGITFVPQQTAYATELVPPPILTAQATAPVTGSIYITNTPDDGFWRSNITSVTVNGSVLPSSAYNTNTAGYIVLIPSASPLLQTSGTKTIVITANGYSTNSVTQTLTVGAPNKLAIKTEPSTPVGVGAAFGTQPAVYIEDIYGNVITTATSNVVAQAVGLGSLSGSTSATAVAGVATFSGLDAPTVAQTGLKLAFSSTSLANVTNVTAITVNAGAATHLAFGVQPTATVAGTAISPSVTVIVQDAYNNTVTSDTSSVTIASGNTAFTGSSTLSVNAVAGVATFSNINPTTAGTLKTLAANDVADSLSFVNSSTFTVGAGSPSQLVITTQPAAPAVNGGALTTQPALVIEDAYGNLVSTATSNVVAQVGSGTWTLGGITTKAAVSGSAAFTGLTATSPSAVTGATISFTSGSLTGATSTAFNIPSPIASSLGGVKLSNGQFVFTFTNTPGLNISVLSTNNLTVPRPWPVVGTAVEGPSGTYNFTNGTPTNGQQYYYTQP